MLIALVGAAVALLHDARTPAGPAAARSLVIYCMYNEGEPYQKYFDGAVDRFSRAMGGVDVEVVYAGREVMGKLRPRILIGNPPDLVNQGGGLFMPLLRDDLIEPLDAELDTPSWGGGERWRDTFLPGIIDVDVFRGRHYLVPTGLGTSVWFYNITQFEKLGIQPPDTWSQFLHVCEVLKSAGIEPIASDGTIPGYNAGHVLAILMRLTTYERFLATATNEPGTSWTEDRYLEAARLIAELKEKGYIMQGYEGSMWPSAQMQWVQGKCGMIYTGTWLPVEIREAMPPGFRIGVFRFPRVEGYEDSDYMVQEIGTGVFAIPRGARNRETAVEFLKFVTSVEEMRAQTALENISSVRGVEMPESLKGVDKFFLPPYRLTTTAIMLDAPEWYRIVARDRLSDLWLGRYAADGFVTGLQAAHDRYYERQAETGGATGRLKR